MDVITLTIPTVYKNHWMDEEYKTTSENFRKYIDSGYKITHVTSAALGNVLYVIYVMERN